MIRAILFDLDNTLYPASSGLDREIDRRMTVFVARYLGISEKEAHVLRKTDARVYGTTLQWLREMYGFHDIEAYMTEVHPTNVSSFLSYNPKLEEMLSSLPYPKVILTNSPLEHADRVLECLKIRSYFDAVLDIRFNQFRGKPYPEAYYRAVHLLGTQVEEVLFVDDLLPYLTAFKALGGHPLLIDEEGNHTDIGIPAIPTVIDLPLYLSSLAS
ncbi:MAG: HAD-IA family hydrolase [Spirochaetes bacterium]|nr:HAD-IA family hydrolase [Spirochaetota bacterium]